MSEAQTADVPKKRGCLVRLARLAGLFLVGAIAIWFVLPFGARSGLLPGTAREIVENADYFEIISLDPYRTHEGKDRFHGYVIRGRAELRDPDMRKRLLSALYSSLGHGMPGILCFDPRHAIHAVRNGHSVDLLVCFQCEQVEGFVDDKRTDALVGPGAERAFETIFQATGLPTAAQ